MKQSLILYTPNGNLPAEGCVVITRTNQNGDTTDCIELQTNPENDNFQIRLHTSSKTDIQAGPYENTPSITNPSPHMASKLKPITGHILEIGDRVRMNIAAFLQHGDLDGVEITDSGENYWKYMCSHPDEIYTVEDFDYSDSDHTTYVLSGAMAGNNWYPDELLFVPTPQTRYELMKAMTDTELAGYLSQFVEKTKTDVLRWLEEKP